MSKDSQYDHQRMGSALRAEREKVGLSLTEAAGRAGIGKSTLSVLESGAGNPRVETLWSLASVYNVPLSRIIDPPTPDIDVTRAEELNFLESEDSAYRVALVSPGEPSTRRDLYYITAGPGTVKSSTPHPRGTVEYVFITSGRAVVGVQDRTITLEVGDCVRYPGDVPHTFEALEDGTTGVTVVEG
ncbi:helix-turn-helix domain-containing protein [Corynebacterium variabile]|uniref:helix-turn-helix domain-containing protein n=1 Tax=Corynebacterium variabile TaxID=1727 RepID=UPI003F9777A4